MLRLAGEPALHAWRPLSVIFTRAILIMLAAGLGCWDTTYGAWLHTLELLFLLSVGVHSANAAPRHAAGLVGTAGINQCQLG